MSVWTCDQCSEKPLALDSLTVSHHNSNEGDSWVITENKGNRTLFRISRKGGSFTLGWESNEKIVITSDGATRGDTSMIKHFFDTFVKLKEELITVSYN